MNILDIIFLIPLLFALYRGFKKGIIHMVASIAALVLGIIGAIKLRPVFASMLEMTVHAHFFWRFPIRGIFGSFRKALQDD